MIYSYSSLSTYLNCPKQFYHKYVARDALPYQGEAAAKGTEVHEAIEQALKTRTALPEPFTIYEESISSVRKKIDNARIEQTIYLDHNFDYAITRPKKGFVAKLDVMLLSDDGKRAVVIDWKHGKPRTDDLQHTCYALAVSKAYPTVERVSGYNVYLNYGEIGAGFHFEKDELPKAQQRVANIIATIEADEHYTPRKSGLCSYCSAPKCVHLPKVRK